MKARWEALFKGPLSEHTTPQGLKDGVLLVVVDSPAWIQQLNYLKPDIISKLAGFGIRDLKFRLGTVRKKQSCTVAPSRYIRGPSEEERAMMEELTKGIDNPELSESIRRAAFKSLSSRNSERPD